MDLDVEETRTVSPAEAFTALGNEKRMSIVEALYEAGGPDGPGRLSFSELYDRTDIRDSGQFSYHLDELLGLFVRETGAGYGLTYAGAEVCRTVAANVYHGQAEIRPTPLETDCPACDAVLELSYENDQLSVTCSACPVQILDLPFPYPAIRSQDDLVTAASLRTHQLLLPIAHRVCPDCGGPLETDVIRIDTLPFDPGPNRDVYGRQQCQGCGTMHFPAASVFVLYHPHTVAAYDRADVALFRQPVRRNALYRSDRHLTVAETDDRSVVVDIDLLITDAGVDFTIFGDGTVRRRRSR